jgi:hypothetical protein
MRQKNRGGAAAGEAMGSWLVLGRFDVTKSACSLDLLGSFLTWDGIYLERIMIAQFVDLCCTPKGIAFLYRLNAGWNIWSLVHLVSISVVL